MWRRFKALVYFCVVVVWSVDGERFAIRDPGEYCAVFILEIWYGVRRWNL
jgi:hypothetical protein